MPEGDTVFLAGQHLHAALAGEQLTRTDFRVPALATTDLAGWMVTDVTPRGKHLLFRLDPPTSSTADALTLHSHFRMDGTWHLYRHGQRWRGGPAWQVRAILETVDWVAVGYRLPVLELVRRDEEERIVGHLGPDLLGPDWDPDEALRRLTADPTRGIGEALLDQRNLAGVGNLYKTEVCFLRGVTPWTPVGDVPDLAGLVELAQRLLMANRSSWTQVTTGDTRRDRQHWVFERQGRPCRRCGTTILFAEQGQPPDQRLSYWCPSCQRGPAPPPLRRSDRAPAPAGYRKYSN